MPSYTEGHALHDRDDSNESSNIVGNRLVCKKIKNLICNTDGTIQTDIF